VVASPAIETRFEQPAAECRLACLEAQITRETQAIGANTVLSAALVFGSTATAYALGGAARYVFFTALLLFIQQLFATRHHARVFALRGALNAARGGFTPSREPRKLRQGAALAIREAYLLLFLAFDVVWLFHAYAAPEPATSWPAYLERLSVGPLSGQALLVFTAVFWWCYLTLYFYGDFVARDAEANASAAIPGGARAQRVPLSVPVALPSGRTLGINGYRLVRRDAPALILWPGFFQNGAVYDLAERPGSLAEYLHAHGFDVWIFHPRGTGGSDGKRVRSTLDDYAGRDLPAIVSFVSARASAPPILVGHSQGGITSILSLMGVVLDATGAVSLSDAAARERQAALGGLVTLGAFPSFAFDAEVDLQRFVRRGFPIRLFGRVLFHVPLPPLLRLARLVPHLNVPVSAHGRRALLASPALRTLVWPVHALLDWVARRDFWEFLYHVPNVSLAARRRLFFATIEGTFTGILQQFQAAVSSGSMRSHDERIDYSEHYARIALPVSFVSMELDGFVDPRAMMRLMCERVASPVKFVTHAPGIGHEDFFMEPRYFSVVLEAVEKLTRVARSRPWSSS
jgi:predicted alpha/beta hydrolase